MDAGSNGCVLEIHALNNAFYDVERLGPLFGEPRPATPQIDADVPMFPNPRVRPNMSIGLHRIGRRADGHRAGDEEYVIV
jgi:hypothetical protein